MLQVGDRLGEWEVIGRPYTTAGGETAHVRVRKVASPDATEIRSWSAHKRVAVSSVRD